MTTKKIFKSDAFAAIHASAAYFSDRGRSFQRDRGRRFKLIVDAQGCAQARK